MNLEFKDKYLKYKKKYLDLKDLMAGGESKLTPEQERANAFLKVINFIELVDKKDEIFIKDEDKSKIRIDLPRFEAAVKYDEETLAEYKKNLQNIDDEIAKEKKKILAVGKKLARLEAIRKEYVEVVIEVKEMALNKLKEIVEHGKKMEPVLINVIDAKNKIHENLNQNLEKYFKIDKKNRIYIVKIKEINSLFDAILSYKEALDQFTKLLSNQPKKLKNGKNNWRSKAYDNPNADPFEGGRGKIQIPYEAEELIINLPGVGKNVKRISDYWYYFSNDLANLEEEIANLIAFKNDYLNKESKKYIDSDITYDKI